MFSLLCVIMSIVVGVCTPGPMFLLSGWICLVSCPFQGGWGYSAGVGIPEWVGRGEYTRRGSPRGGGGGIPRDGRYTRGHVYPPPPSHGTWNTNPLPALAITAHTVGEQAVRILLKCCLVERMP